VPATTLDRRWRWAVLAAVVLYCFWGGLLIMQGPGLQYDEALLVLGSVHMRISPHELDLPHDTNTWVPAFGRWFPLMTARYVGAAKEYLCLPLFGLFGARTEALRIVSMLLGAFGIWGIAKLIGEQTRAPQVAAMVAFVIAINPAYVDLTVFDNGTVAIWMGSVGLLSLVVSRYLRLRTAKAAFWVGVAMGLGVWARANFVWLLAAVLLASILILKRRFFSPVSHWASVLAGGILGGFPFLFYQFISHGGTWEATKMFSSSQTFAQRLPSRLVMFSEVLLSDREHRAMWDGPPMPSWQAYLFPAVVAVACVVNFALTRKSDQAISLWARIMSMTFVLLTAILISTRMNVSEHHLIVLVPFAAVVVVLASYLICAKFPSARPIVAAVAAAYLSSALYWQISAVGGLMRTGGVGQWSDGVFALERHLQEKYRGQDIKILDWGLQNNLYLISDGQLRSREIFADASLQGSGRGQSWKEEIREGGVFVLNGPDYRQFPTASAGFLQALAEVHPSTKRLVVRQRAGGTYAEIIEVQPNTGQYPAAKSDGVDSANQLEGFHQLEETGWRWTRQKFAVTFNRPGKRLTLDVYIPDSSIQKLGPITLTARQGSHVLQPETYEKSGRYSYVRNLEAGGPNRIDFGLDKSIPPSRSDGRELGIVVVRVSIDPQL
jgi:hypothetical protein